MRTIKFRAFIDGEMIGADKLFFNEYAPLSEVLAREKNLMQYTGLKDKNGKEIYEGDIVKRVVEKPFQTAHGKSTLQEIVYRNGMWICSYVSSESGKTFPRGYTAGEINNSRENYNKDIVFYDGDNQIMEIEVIGNIHENPELL